MFDIQKVGAFYSASPYNALDYFLLPYYASSIYEIGFSFLLMKKEPGKKVFSSQAPTFP